MQYVYIDPINIYMNIYIYTEYKYILYTDFKQRERLCTREKEWPLCMAGGWARRPAALHPPFPLLTPMSIPPSPVLGTAAEPKSCP